MESISLTDMAEEKLTQARHAHSGRAAHTIHGGHDHELRQTVMALLAGHELAEHDSPREATLQVLCGHVRLNTNSDVPVRWWHGDADPIVPLGAAQTAAAHLSDAELIVRPEESHLGGFATADEALDYVGSCL